MWWLLVACGTGTGGDGPSDAPQTPADTASPAPHTTPAGTPAPTGDTAGPTPTRSPAETGDSAMHTGLPVHTGDTAPPAFVPAVYRVLSAQLGVHDGRVGPVWNIDKFGTRVQVPLRIGIALGDATAVDVLTPDNHCVVYLTTVQPVARADWEPVHGLWTAFEMPADADVGATTCDTLDFAPPWGAAPEDVLLRHSWGVGVGPLDPDDRDTYAAGLPDDLFVEREPFLVGGGAWTSATEAWSGGVATANRMDDERTIVRTPDYELVPIPADDVPVPVGVTDAYYEVKPLYWRPVDELL